MKNLFPSWIETKSSGLPTAAYGLEDQGIVCLTLGISDFQGNALDYTQRQPWQILPASLNLRGMVSLNQVHGTKIHSVGIPPSSFCNLGDGDGLTTTTPGVLLTVRTADCIPLWLYDNQRLTLLHVGYRGLALGIVEKGLALHCPHPKARIGLHLRSCCLEVKGDVISLFTGHEKYLDSCLRSDAGKTFLDMSRMLRLILEEAGVTDISEHMDCTACNDWYSYRKTRTSLRLGHAGCMLWQQTSHS